MHVPDSLQSLCPKAKGVSLWYGVYRLAFAAVIVLFLPQLARAFCHEAEVAGHGPFSIIPAAAGPRALTIQWLGHSAFYLTSSRGTKVLMDPHGRGVPPMDISPHVVTTSHFGWNHSYIWMANGNPIVLHGLNMANGNWIRLHKTIRDVSIFTVPTYHDSEMGMARGRNTVFVVSMDGICVAHLGDLGHLLNGTQVKMMGKIDVLLVPLGQGGYRISTEDALKIVASVKPKIVIPYHYSWEGYAKDFAQNFPRVRNMEGSGVKLSKVTLKTGPEIIVLRDLMQDLE